MNFQIRSETAKIRDLIRQGGQRFQQLGLALQALDKKVLPILMAVTQLTGAHPPAVNDAEVMAALQTGPPPKVLVTKNLDQLDRLAGQLQRELSASAAVSQHSLQRKAGEVYKALISVHAASQLAASQPELQVAGAVSAKGPAINPWQERVKWANTAVREVEAELAKFSHVRAYAEGRGDVKAAVTALNDIAGLLDAYLVSSWVVYTGGDWSDPPESPASVLARLGANNAPAAVVLQQGERRLRAIVKEVSGLVIQQIPFDLNDNSVRQGAKQKMKSLVREGQGLTQALRILVFRAGDTSSLANKPPTTSVAEGYQDYSKAGAAFVKGRGDRRAMHWNDIRQGELGTCYMLAALRGLLLDRPQLADQIFLEKLPGDKYRLKIYERREGSGQWTEKNLEVTPNFPVHTNAQGANAPAYAKLGDTSVLDGKTVREYWPGLVELAVAKAHGGFQNVVGGSTADGFKMLSQPTSVTTHRTSQLTANEIKRMLKQAKRNKFPIVAGTDGFNEELGLKGPHAYTVHEVTTRKIHLLGTRPEEHVKLTAEEFKRGFSDFTIAEY